MTSWISALIWLATAAAGPAHVPDPPEQARPILVELFTSQGCPLCPAANLYLGELDEREDVIALGFAVDYWDIYGWRDTYAQPAFTERQRLYKTSLDVPRVYTPQFVIDGAAEAEGRQTDAILSALQRRRMAMMDGVHVATLATGNGNHTIEVSGAPPSASEIWLAVFEPGWHTVEIEAGENAGLDMQLYNPVRALIPLGHWAGGQAEYGAALPEGTSGVIIVQGAQGGPVYGVGEFEQDGEE